MVSSNESRAELIVRRRVKLADDETFLNKARAIAEAAFGQNRRGAVTLMPPLVEESVIRPAGSPIAKVYDPENLDLKLLWRVSVGDTRAGAKFYYARNLLEKGQRQKIAPAKHRLGHAQYREITPPLKEAMARATMEKFETMGPTSEVPVRLGQIVVYQHPMVHEDTYIFGLSPSAGDVTFSFLMTEQRAAENALAEASAYAFSKPNPQPMLTVPFMRVHFGHHDSQRQDFLEQIQVPNILPVQATLQPVGMTTSA